ncbi:MAG: hypothetical protein DHS20C01_34510 [marine bacterium B5-7]|nr:MAG: hypothetical protein DHS20C01_34510 [marine bacterium B5-7]
MNMFLKVDSYINGNLFVAIPMSRRVSKTGSIKLQRIFSIETHIGENTPVGLSRGENPFSTNGGLRSAPPIP